MIWGVTGQSGSYLSELLLEKGYRVVGVARRVSVGNDQNVKHLLDDENFQLVSGDVTDAPSVFRLILRHQPDEIYNLAAQSHVRVSFEEPSHTWDVTAKGCLNILEAIRTIEERAPAGTARIRFYQASSSEMFGGASSRVYAGEYVYEREEYRSFEESERSLNRDAGPVFQDENTCMLPRSSYAIAKLAAHHAVRLYRESYGLFACSGILFNHESSRRSEAFVTRKITKHVASLAASPGNARMLRLGNLDACRDWGHAEDYVRGVWMMLQQDRPGDYVLATGVTHTVEEFLEAAFACIGIEPMEGTHYEIDSSFFRPSEVAYLRGSAAKAKKVLGWEPKISFEQLVSDMVHYDICQLRKNG